MQGWQDMDRGALDDAYANAAYIPGAADYPGRWASEAAEFRATTPCDLDIAYDVHPNARLDLFRPAGPAKGLVVFIHGGYWHLFGKSDWSHFAGGALGHDHAVAIIGYPLAPGASLTTITTCIARAIDCAAARVAGPIRITGHSAGGHLAARMVMADAAPQARARIATCVPISPLADLRPIQHQTLNDDLQLTQEEVLRESPVLGRPIKGPKSAIHVGAQERPSFHWQAEALSTAWTVPLRQAPGRHHFDVIDALRDPASDLMPDLMA